MMSGGIAGRIGFRLNDATAEAARGEIVDDNSSDEEASEIDGVRWKLSAAEAADGEFCREFVHGRESLWSGGAI